MAHTTVFVVSSDPAIRDSVSELVASASLPSAAFRSLEAWLEAVQPAQPGCLVLDARGCDFHGQERHATYAAVFASRPVVLLIDRGDVPAAVRAIKFGVVDVLEKPYRDENLLERIRRVAPAGQDVNAES